MIVPNGVPPPPLSLLAHAIVAESWIMDTGCTPSLKIQQHTSTYLHFVVWRRVTTDTEDRVTLREIRILNKLITRVRHVMRCTGEHHCSLGTQYDDIQSSKKGHKKTRKSNRTTMDMELM